MAYTEFWFTDVLWPDFSEKHLQEAISSFQRRERRYGGIGNGDKGYNIVNKNTDSCYRYTPSGTCDIPRGIPLLLSVIIVTSIGLYELYNTVKINGQFNMNVSLEMVLSLFYC